MSRYSGEPDMLTQHITGFECGYDMNETLLELSEDEQALYGSPVDVDKINVNEEQSNPESVPAPAPASSIIDDNILDDSIYDAPEQHVTFADFEEDYKETFNTGSIVSTITYWFNFVCAYVKENWIKIVFAVSLLVIVYCWFYKYGIFAKYSIPFSLSDSSSADFIGSVSSLGSTMLKYR